MKTITYQCLDIVDVCKHNGIDYDEVMEAIGDSEVSFGNNADTFIRGSWLKSLLGTDLNFGEHDDNVLIRLGC